MYICVHNNIQGDFISLDHILVVSLLNVLKNNGCLKSISTFEEEYELGEDI
jgi:hypothetical protein